MSRTIAATAMVIFLSQLAPAAAQAEVTRQEYVQQGEPICKANTIANRNILQGVRVDVREGKLRRAGSKFGRAARALDQTIENLELIPQPATDESRLVKWFIHFNDEASLLERVADQLHTGTRGKLSRYVIELEHNANVTNNVVLTFGFEYCLLQTARYI